MTTANERLWDKWKMVGIFICVTAFLGLVVFAIFADSTQRNANRTTLERLETENKKTRDAVWNLYKYEKSQFDSIHETLRRIEKKGK